MALASMLGQIFRVGENWILKSFEFALNDDEEEATLYTVHFDNDACTLRWGSTPNHKRWLLLPDDGEHPQFAFMMGDIEASGSPSRVPIGFRCIARQEVFDAMTNQEKCVWVTNCIVNALAVMFSFRPTQLFTLDQWRGMAQRIIDYAPKELFEDDRDQEIIRIALQ